jgi:hypothetical protein
MKKLVAAYRKLPSPSNRSKLQEYLNLNFHMACLLTPEDEHFLRVHKFTL